MHPILPRETQFHGGYRQGGRFQERSRQGGPKWQVLSLEKMVILTLQSTVSFIGSAIKDIGNALQDNRPSRR
ncbi:hypothetical protein JOY44_17230 [Phormidium sp. CLA17]|uniref:hypothetical protein n=1 Tax=Leptolyngbya sp. Cla-17 TaxID=2803751 RepID=UPI0018D6868F|nr:hypothetical protein [Leptolyngbya sp. Cla-17]MBM0743334.1 hypothetical protein [Leptolyngbya sp. Cla-17]